jgi:molybdopterin/thiamine biosynthesis adenylyltransferase
MNDDQLLRYSRQILLLQVGVEGQERLMRSRVLVVGAGGLGSPVALYLAAAGVGALAIADFDRVDLTNLQRQILHATDRIGTPKVESAVRTLGALNPEVRVVPIARHLEGELLAAEVAQADVVVDGSDNFATRFAVNAACVAAGRPLVSGAVVRWEGQVSVFSDRPEAPCYRCLYGAGGEIDDTCTHNGVLGPVAGIVGTIQATEALKLLTGTGTTLSGRLLLLDALEMRFRTLALAKDPHCPVCRATA